MTQQDKDLTPAQVLLRMRDLTAMTGAVEELQLRHLRVWGGVVFGAVKYEVKVDLIRQKVIFRAKEKCNAQRNPVLLDRLARSVQWLLGEHWGVTVKTRAWHFEVEGTSCQTSSHPPQNSSPSQPPETKP